MKIELPRSLSIFLHFLRGFSAQLVVIGHGLNFSKLGEAVKPPNFPYIQNIGVLVFFFLSGIVICFSIHSKLPRGGYGYLEFIFDRAVRFGITIVPCLVVIYLLDIWSFGIPQFKFFEDNISVGQFFGNALMLQNHPLFDVVPFGTGRPLWTVSLEWWTYMFFGFLILMPLTSQKRLVASAVIFVLSVPMILTQFTDSRGLVFVWLLGAIAYYFLQNGPRIVGVFRWAIILGLFAVLLPYFYEQLLTMGKSYSLSAGLAVSIFLFMLFYIVSHAPAKGGGLFERGSQYVAEYSFTLYCIHYSVYEFLIFVAGASSWTLLLSGFVVSNILALSVAYFTEFRYKAYRRWLKDRIPGLFVHKATQV